MPHQITVLIPCKNEIDNIESCIVSARGIADEVLVADSGSTDGTLEVAKRLADRVVEREYVNSGDFKNWGIPQAKHAWVFILDADERIPADLAREIRDLVAQSPDQWAFTIRRRNYFLGHALDHGDWSRDKVTRLLRREHCRYELYTDHAEIRVAAGRLGALQCRMIHYTAWSLLPYLSKMHHYADQQAQLWHQRGKRPKLLNVVFNAPLRFLRSYLLRAGFRDGMIGFLIASLTAYYSFVKQFMLWEKTYGRRLRDLDSRFTEHAADSSRSAA